jgi:hypothetical protein
MKTIEWALADGKMREKELAWLGFDGKAVEKLQAGADEKTVGTSSALRPNGALPAPRGVHSSFPNSFGVSSTTSSAAGTPAQLPTPSPSPPPDFLPPSSVAESASKNPTSRLSPVTRLKNYIRGAEQRTHPLQVLADATHLLTSLRGIGYAWGPPLKALPAPEHSHGVFLRKAAKEFVTAHTISTLALAFQVLHRDDLLAPFLSSNIPYLSPKLAHSFSSLLARILVGLSLHAQMLIGFAGANIVFLLLAYLTNYIVSRFPERWGWTWRAHYDVREYPPLFNKPFERLGEGGVTAFWGKRWHALFRSSYALLPPLAPC